MNSEAMKGKEQSIMSGGAEMEREKRERTEGRETREEISEAVSDGFHVSTSGAELAPGGCGWTLMRKVLVVMEEAHE